jgi:hypothetical protein
VGVGRYGKYKELTRPVQCKECKQCKIRLAYRTLCDPCAKSSQRCPACCEYKSEEAKCAPSRTCVDGLSLASLPPVSLARSRRVGGTHSHTQPRKAAEDPAGSESLLRGLRVLPRDLATTASIDGGIGITLDRPLRPPREGDTAGAPRVAN